MKKKENNLGQNKFILPLLLVIIALLLVVIVVLLVKDSNNKLYKDENIVDSNDNYNDTTNSDTSINNDNSLDNSSNDENNNTNKDNYIGKDKALDIVLEKEGISKNDIFDLSCELDYKYNQMVYEIDFNYKNYEYEYYLSASDGKIIHSFKERD